MTTLLEVGLQVRDFMGTVGYDTFLLCFYLPTLLREQDSLFLLNGYPPKWLEVYTQRNYVDFDPVLKRQLHCTEPFEWCDLDVRTFNPRAAEMFTEAARFGVFSGMSFRILGRAGSQLLVNLSVSRYRRLGAQRDAVFGAAVLFGTRALETAFSLVERDPKAILSRLSARQLEALRWVTQGLSLREVGIKMGLAAPHVEYLMRQAQVNVGAGSHEETILLAAQTGPV